MSAGEVRLVEVGNFLKTFSLNDLENVDIEKDLGLSGDYESNSTDEQERAALAWKVRKPPSPTPLSFPPSPRLWTVCKSTTLLPTIVRGVLA